MRCQKYAHGSDVLYFMQNSKQRSTASEATQKDIGEIGSCDNHASAFYRARWLVKATWYV